tara:strand:+ start:105 stop:269 length:165 start_codon:yes stop_codon:yes gene_type:complete
MVLEVLVEALAQAQAVQAETERPLVPQVLLVPQAQTETELMDLLVLVVERLGEL